MGDEDPSSGSRDFPRVGIVCPPRIDVGGKPIVEARKLLEQRGFRAWTYCATAEEPPGPGALNSELDGTRLIVSVGGDGTLLWTAQHAPLPTIPLLPITPAPLAFPTHLQLGP